MQAMHESKPNVHVKLCSVSDGIKIISTPGEDYMYTFSVMHARIQSFVVEYNNCNSNFDPLEKGNVVTLHELCSYSYVLVDRQNLTVAQRV